MSQSEQIEALRRQFPTFFIGRLKFIFSKLDGDFSTTLQFLKDSFPDQHHPPSSPPPWTQQTGSQVPSPVPQPHANSIFGTAFKRLRSTPTPQLQALYTQYRTLIFNYVRLYKASKTAVSRLGGRAIPSASQGSQGLKNKIEDLKKRSIFAVYELSRRTGHREVDLHYLMIDEAEQALYAIFEDIEAQKGPGTHVIEIIVGRGNHSQKGPILLPYFRRHLKELGYEIKVNAGSITCII